jgi:uncharacterized ubiquitin-like protein YukD
LKIKIVSAIGGDTLDLKVDPLMTISDIKKMVAEKKKIPPSTIVVTFHTREQPDNVTLKEAGISDGDKLFAVTRTLGG